MFFLKKECPQIPVQEFKTKDDNLNSHLCKTEIHFNALPYGAKCLPRQEYLLPSLPMPSTFTRSFR